ncbi:hypothetical protein QTN47_13115 [Danxiaibacter flavus]|uniref:Exo-alpha-sialidase n=1 Tax=Danxiaibacter flavus TaxID=3049108 RepID=A0ABV3ZEZ8_9BACT|nr:hypothetical protein QNM32_13120 [Chitinophagaceae bacterium DXS]
MTKKHGLFPVDAFWFVFGTFLMLLSCNKDTFPSGLTNFGKIWSNNNYSAFTDLIRYNNLWYCVFREADSHVGTNGTIRVLVSDNARNWRSLSVLQIPENDLRDPKFVINFKHELCIYAGAIHKPNSLQNIVWVLNTSDLIWGNPINMQVKDDWLWRINNNLKEMYSFAYSGNGNAGTKISYYLSDAGSFPNFKLQRANIIDDGCPSETAMTFQDSTIYVIARRDCGDKNSWLGISDQAVRKIEWFNLNMILQSPSMINTPHGIFVAGRIYPPSDIKVAIFKLNTSNRALEKITNLPSGYDTGYPGLAFYNDSLYISYYSADESNFRAIYLSAYKLK